MGSAKSFRNLKVYQAAREAAGRIFELSKRFSREERYSLTDQIRRSSRAVKAIIAEAWARRRYKAAFVNKIDEALGEAYETQSWLDDALDGGYLSKQDFDSLDDSYAAIGGMLSRMIDRADDFCKYAPTTDYRSVTREAESPVTDHCSLSQIETADILKKIRTLEIKTRGLVETAFAGDYHSVFKGRGMNFEDVREYQPGDEIRTIDWNVTARLGTAFVKKFTEERELTVMLIVDVSASGNFGSTSQSKRELAAEVACLLAFSAIRNNDKVGLLLFTDRVELFIPPKKGRSHTLRLIREILFFEPEGRGTNPALALDSLNKIVPRRAVVFFISDFQAPDFSKSLAVSGLRHDFIAIRVQDEREKVLPNIGIITLEDAETGEQIEINTADRATRTRFGDLADEQAAELSRTLRRSHIDAIALRTSEDY